jgi:hypothetical protein
MVESALCVLAFLLMVLAIADIGQFLFIQQTLTERVRHALARGSRTTYNETAVRNLVMYGTETPSEGQSPLFNLTAEMVSVSHQSSGTVEDRIEVRVSGHPLNLLTPGLSQVGKTLPIRMTTAYDAD